MSPMDLMEDWIRQSEIIEKQTAIIDDLFLQLIQYVSIDEEEKELAMIQEAARMQEEY